MNQSPNTLSDVLAAIRNSVIEEHLNANVELKSNWKEDYGHKASALANKYHQPRSWLIVGVDDSGCLLGRDQNWARQQEQCISQHINEKLDPAQACVAVHTLEIDGAYVVIIELKNPGDVVYWGANAYSASGTTLHKMEPEEILELRLKLPGLSDLTKQPLKDSYQENLVNIFVNRLSDKGHMLEQGAPDEVLRFLHLYGTRAASILFGGTRFRVVRYDTYDNPISNDTLVGLYTLLTDSYQNEVQEWTKQQTGALITPYPTRALQEAFANAVAHAAYFENNGDIILELHPERLCISNLCIRESMYFANRWFSRAHRTVNAFLMETLRLGKHVDELGRGKNLIFAESIRHGKRPPEVHTHQAGRYFRWGLTLHGNASDVRQLRIFSGINKQYGDTPKALIAQALILWSSKPVKEIRNYIDGNFADEFVQVLTDLRGPIYYYQKEDRIVPQRWVKDMLSEGKDVKQFSPSEEERELAFLRDFCGEFENGYISPKFFRDMEHLSDTPSAKSYSSRILKKWKEAGHIKKVRSGLYRFPPGHMTIPSELSEFLQKMLSSKSSEEEAESTGKQEDIVER
jgi:predicted HTH transcriptional regulator